MNGATTFSKGEPNVLTFREDIPMNHIFLSICIPTYNRLNTLKQCINRVIEARKRYLDSVEIIVSDNCSDDGTSEYLYSIKEPNFSYFRNSENLGFNKNLFLLIDKYAKGDFVWAIGDDDYISQFSLDLFFSHYMRLDLLLLKYEVSNTDRIDDDCKRAKTLIVTNESYFKSIDEIADYGNLLATFMSCAIFKRSFINCIDKSSIQENDWSSFDKVFPNGFLLSQAFHSNNNVYWANEPYIFIIPSAKEWDDKMRLLADKVLPDFYFYLCKNRHIRRQLFNTSRYLYMFSLRSIYNDKKHENTRKVLSNIIRLGILRNTADFILCRMKGNNCERRK